MQLSLADRFAGALEFLTLDQHDTKLGVAVSGGGDSMALLYLAADWGRANGFSVHAVTVDHGLRDGSAQEAALVAKACAGLDISHDTLKWTGWDGGGNLQKAARDARRELIRDWAAGRDIDLVLLGHTADDQAETVLMRLARGSGVDGLGGMSDGDVFLRPLLGVGREELRDELRTRGVAWVDDPSNDDLRFDRVKARQMMGHLAELGLTRERLVQTAQHMQRARASLNVAMRQLAQEAVEQDHGDLILSPEVYRFQAFDHHSRLLAAALRWVGGAEYRPRYEALLALSDVARKGQGQTLAGCLVTPEPGRGIRISREMNAVQEPLNTTGAGVSVVWDRRWLIMREIPRLRRFAMKPHTHYPDIPSGLSIAALGEEGIKACPDWRDSGLPRASLLASPSVWDGETLIGAPLTRNSNGWTARIVTDFHDWLLSH